ncbi:unnamed protein product [Trifolium pratense]|uniref:Uncharacterized protein n=1 Tax=Trifolium pratense TaxID=57577 RepID=A0ACB0JWP4_TRIPR|nr:unnamed protein product [Trifolium pratense]
MTFEENTITQTPLALIPHYTILECVLGLCFTTFNILLLVPYDYIDKNPVPAVIFKGRTTTFQAFLVCIIFAFSGATNAIVAASINSRFGRFCGYYSMVSMASAFAILLWAIFCTCIH